MESFVTDREPLQRATQRSGEIDFADQPAIAVLYVIAGGLMEFFGPMFWAALIVLFVQAEIFAQ
jgi:hypothetical protein